MNSRQLGSRGFRGWYGLGQDDREELLKSVPRKKGVYAMKYQTQFGRFRGKSDLLYIGSSVEKKRGLRGRIASYFHPGKTQKTSQRIHDLLQDTPGVNISFLAAPKVKDPRKREKELRKEYQNEHGELPPWNRNA